MLKLVYDINLFLSFLDLIIEIRTTADKYADFCVNPSPRMFVTSPFLGNHELGRLHKMDTERSTKNALSIPGLRFLQKNPVLIAYTLR